MRALHLLLPFLSLVGPLPSAVAQVSADRLGQSKTVLSPFVAELRSYGFPVRMVEDAIKKTSVSFVNIDENGGAAALYLIDQNRILLS